MLPAFLVVGDGMGGDGVNQPDVMSQLSKKLGLKVVLQMENQNGDVVFEDTVSSRAGGSNSATDGTGSSPAEGLLGSGERSYTWSAYF